VLICGTTDSKKHFHPFSVNICSNETWEDYFFMFCAMKKSLYSFYIFEYRPNILIADAAPAITNGFMKAFDYESEDEFIRVMCWAHVDRWDKWKDNIDVSKFIEHFKTEWIEKNKGWYEGFTDGHIPSTDNVLEAENRVVKDILYVNVCLFLNICTIVVE
jgi:hypothetical protein